MQELIVCEHCHRHHLASERECPFCRRPTPSAARGLTAAILFGMGLTLTGCGGDTDDGKTGGNVTGDSGTDGSAGGAGGQGSGGMGGIAPAYGPPPMGGTAGQGGMVAAYGPPPMGGAAGQAAGGQGGAAGQSAGGQGGAAPAYGPPPSGGSGGG
ncbi:MAG: RING-HC finger protein [Polyangiaceae bacterium]|nr:RING-HC finger protein [Polyangiaceae bacterium]